MNLKHQQLHQTLPLYGLHSSMMKGARPVLHRNGSHCNMARVKFDYISKQLPLTVEEVCVGRVPTRLGILAMLVGEHGGQFEISEGVLPGDQHQGSADTRPTADPQR